MAEQTDLQSEIGKYSQWRAELGNTIQELSLFLKDNNVTDLRTHHQFELVLGALADDNLSVAFVAEFSRGKSEMINTIFFGDYRQRILPSGSGRTTMCPTELMYDPNMPSSIRLLPIESRTRDEPLYELKKAKELWQETQFDPENVDQMVAALSNMTNSKLVSKAYAHRLKFDTIEDQDSGAGLPVNEFDEVEIPSWRHAIINIPHPLLEQGLVILDTPGLNAIGAEPELTINQLATAHTVVFILSQDSGVTASDLALWQEHLGGSTGKNDSKRSAGSKKQASRKANDNKLVALNKIDALWDGIRSEQEIDYEIDRQTEQTAQILEIDPQNIFPVSAQKGLLGRVSQDPELVERSRISDLERAIGERLVPQKRQIVTEKVQGSLAGIIDTAGSILNNRLKDADSHIAELKQISSKNTDVISHIMLKVQGEKSSLEQDMQRYQALRTVYSKETGKLVNQLSAERLEKLIATTKHDMARCASSITLQKTIANYFLRLNEYLDDAMHQANDIAVLSENITRDFEQEHGIANFRVRRLRLEKYRQEVQRLEQKYSHFKQTRTLFFREQMSITNRFYDSVCTASRKIFSRALRDANSWNNNLMVPMETHVREHHAQLRRRLESVKRIHKASDTVETRLRELEVMQSTLVQQLAEFAEYRTRLTSLFAPPQTVSRDGDDTETADILLWEHNTQF